LQSFKEFEMDIELQNLIEQDIDLGIKNGFFYTNNSLNVKSITFDQKNFEKAKLFFQNQYEETEKVL
jgi:hypothetical protein